MSGGGEFADQYWAHVGSGLTRLCIAEARCVAAGVEDFSGALSVVMHHALKLGASYLEPEQLHDLEDKVATKLLTAIAEAEAAGWGEWIERNHIDPTGALI